MAKKKAAVPAATEAWRQPYIDSYNKLMGGPSGLTQLVKTKEERQRQQVAEATPVKKGGRGSSRPGGSVAKARAIFAEMQGKSRAELIAACIKAGINKATAATQYSRWKAGK